MLNRLLRDAVEGHKLTLSLAITFPLMVLIPAFVEAVQHVAEWRIGMFVPGNMLVVQNHPLRIAAGAIKVVSILTVALLAARYWAHGADVDAIRRLPKRTVIAFFRVLIGVIVMLIIVVASPDIARVAVAAGLPLSTRFVSLVPLLILLATTSLTQRKSIAMLGDIVGGEAASPERTRLVARGCPMLFAILLLLAVGPAMWLHYTLNYAAIGKVAAVAALLLGLDAILVGLMAILIGSLIWLGYRDGPSLAKTS